MSSPMADVEWVGDFQPHMAIDAGASIPAGGGQLRIVHPHGDDIVPLEVEMRGEIVFESDEAIRSFAETMAIDPHLAVHEDAVKLDEYLAVQ